MITRRSTRSAMALFALLGALTLAACGGSDSDSSKAEESTEATVASADGGTNAGSSSSTGSGSNSGTNGTTNNGSTDSTTATTAGGGSTPSSAANPSAPNFPVIEILECQINGTSRRLRVSASSAASGDFEGVREVYVLTYNDVGGSVKTNLSHIGYDDEWSSTTVAYNSNYQDKMTIVAKATDGATKSADYRGSSTPCP